MATNFTELDFFTLKQSLIDFLKTKDEFKDFDFDGSGINTLIELLTHNTEYIGFYSNMIANEMFLDTALLRESVVSRAKAIGYRPHSIQASRAKVQLDFNPSLGGGPPSPASILVPQWTKFTTSVENKIYTFLNPIALTVTNNGAGHYIGSLDIVEGSLLTHEFTVDSSLEIKQRYVLPNTGIDAATIVVQVQKSVSQTAVETFFLATDINVIESNSPAYFLQEVEDGKYEIFFGDGVVGKRLEDGNLLRVNYVVTHGEVANGAKKFTPTVTIAGYNGTVITTLQSSKDGLPIESNERIKFVAPQFYEAQNRAVNKHDYETLILKDYPQVEFVRVWGGEENDPPVYGKVYMSLKPIGALSFSAQEKLSIINSIIRPRSPVSIETVIVEPDYLKVIVSTVAKIKLRNSTLTLGDIQGKIIQAIKNYRDSNLLGFDSNFRYTKLTRQIDAADQSIQNNLTQIKLKYTITPPINIAQRFEIHLNAKIDKGDSANNISALNSTGFIKDGLVSYIGDDGMGNLYIYRLVLSQKVIVETNVGTIDYDTGKIILPSLIIQGIPDGKEVIDFILIPGENDLTPVRNQIVVILDEDISVQIINEDA